MAKKKNLYELVTKEILKLMKKGKLPWRRNWGNKSPAIPTNLFTGRPYRGINVLRLMAEDKSAWWATTHQIEALGGRLQEGAKSVMVLSMFAFEDEDGELQFRATSNQVYNLDDCENLSIPYTRVRNERVSEIERCEAFIKRMPSGMPKVKHGGNRACYFWSKDLIAMPHKHSFDDAEAYYATLFHEYGHATGHPSRLNRTWAYDPSEEERAREELIAELTSAFVCASLKIHQKALDEAAGYLKSWLAALEHDPKAFIIAASDAQKAADFLHGVKVKPQKGDKGELPFWVQGVEEVSELAS
jgi:antirestriction protein ArdC